MDLFLKHAPCTQVPASASGGGNAPRTKGRRAARKERFPQVDVGEFERAASVSYTHRTLPTPERV